MRKIKKLISALLLFSILLSACGNIKKDSRITAETSNRTANEASTSEDNVVEPLIVAVFGREDGRGPAVYVGDDMMSEQFIYTDLIRAFSEENNIPVKIVYNTNLSYLGEMNADVFLADTADFSNIMEKISEENCYDLSSFFEDNNIYDDDLYVQSVLGGGQIAGKQLMFPLSFNISLITGSQESLVRHDLELVEGMSFEQILGVFTDALRTVPSGGDRPVPLFANTYPENFPFCFWSGAGGLNYDMTVPEDRLLFEKLVKYYEDFLCADLEMDYDDIVEGCKAYGLSTLLDFSRTNELRTASRIMSFGDWYDQIACVAVGTGTKTYCYYPFAMQALYYEDMYHRQGENFFCMGVPKQETTDGYRAQIVTYGVVSKKSARPKSAFKLLQYLAEAERPVFYDISVCRQQINNTLDILTTSEIDMGDDLIGPMSEATRDTLENLIDHIAEAYYSDINIDNQFFTEMERYLAEKQDIGMTYNRLTSYKQVP